MGSADFIKMRKNEKWRWKKLAGIGFEATKLN